MEQNTLKICWSGQILWVTWDMLIPIALLYAVLLFAWFKWHDHLAAQAFMLFLHLR